MARRALERADPDELLGRYRLLAGACVAPEAERCVQCGICAYNCPLGVDVRAYARRGWPVLERRCLSCGECVRRCPRDALRFAPLPGGGA